MYLAFQGGSDQLPHLGIYPNDTSKVVTNFIRKSMGNFGTTQSYTTRTKTHLKTKFVFLSWILIAWKHRNLRNLGCARSNIQQKINHQFLGFDSIALLAKQLQLLQT